MLINDKSKSVVVIEAFVLMIVLQGIRELLERWISPMIPDTRFAAKMLTMVLMILLTGVVIVYAKLRKQELSAFPKTFSKRYIIATCITVVLYIAAPLNFIEGLTSVMTIVYVSIVTPIYEELLFRGYLWNRFQEVLGNKTAVFVWNVVLFTLWHVGYMVPHIIAGNWFAVLTKVAAGAVYGIVLGFVRKKTGNCWSTILVHGIMNHLMI